MAVVVSGGAPVASVSRASTRPTLVPSIALYGSTLDYAAIYRTQPNVRLVVRFLGRNVAQLGLKGYHRKGETERLPLEPGHALRGWLSTPDTIAPIPVTRHRWMRALVEDLAIFDTALFVKMKNTSTGRLSAVRIPPTNFRVVGDSWLWPEGFEVFGGNGSRIFAPADVIYFAGHNPSDARVGLSSMEALRRTLAEEDAAGRAREDFWRNGARMSGVIERPVDAPKWTPEARGRFVDDFGATWSGPRAGGVPVLEEGMTFHDVTMTAKDAEYLGARRLSREEVAAQYFIPPVFVGILENANFSNVKEQHRSLYSDTLGPWLDWITSDLEVQLVPEFENVDDVYLEINIAEKLRGSFEEEAAAIQTATGAPWLLRDEARAMKDLPPLPNGEGASIVTPLNVLIGGQASATDSAPPPPGLASRDRKALDARLKRALPTDLVGWKAKHEEILDRFFTRQRDSVLSRMGAGQELEAAFDRARWDGELRNDLLALSLGIAEDVGAATAAHLGAEFDPARAMTYLEANAQAAAEGVNAATFLTLGEAYSGVRRGTSDRTSDAKATLTDALVEAGLEDEGADDDLPEDFLDGDAFLAPARDVFAAALAVRVEQIATSRSTSVGNFSRHEGASQAGARTKTWVGSGAANSRHADLDGETVPIGDSFSNGGLWPGDPALGVDETAGCLCSIDFGT